MRAFQYLAVPAIMAAMAVSAYGSPKVDITGLDAATQWIWIEAEDATATNYTVGHYGRTSNSPNLVHETVDGYTPGTLMNQELYKDGSGLSAQWNDSALHLPSAFSNATLYLHYGSYSSRANAIRVGLGASDTYATTLDIINTRGTDVYMVPTAWTSGSLGNLGAGGNTLRLYTAAYNPTGLDGYYIVEGSATMDSGTTALTNYDAHGIAWRGAPAGVSSPVLPSGVAPVITVTDDEHTAITLDGNLYVSGTPITAAGDHVLMIESFGSVFADLGGGDKIYSNRVLVGANFTIVPEPGSVGLLLGMAGWALTSRRRRAA